MGHDVLRFKKGKKSFEYPYLCVINLYKDNTQRGSEKWRLSVYIVVIFWCTVYVLLSVHLCQMNKSSHSDVDSPGYPASSSETQTPAPRSSICTGRPCWQQPPWPRWTLEICTSPGPARSGCPRCQHMRWHSPKPTKNRGTNIWDSTDDWWLMQHKKDRKAFLSLSICGIWSST